MHEYDLIIIGGGVVGSAIAREFSRYKARIALIEKEADLSFGVSKSNSGIIHPGTQNQAGTLKGRLCVEGNRLTRVIAQEVGVDFKEVGELICAFSDDDIQSLFTFKKHAEELGVPRLEIVYKPWLTIHEPNLSSDVVAALYAPSAGIISPYRWVYDLAENAAHNGVDIFTNTKVNCIDRGTPFILQTTNGPFRSRFIVNAAGLFADEIARMVGIDDFTITARKGEEFLLDKKREYLTNHLLFPLPTKTSKGVLVIKTSDGNPMVGPTADQCDDKYDLATSDRGLANVFASVRRMVPSINEQDIIAYFAGLRPVAGNDFIIRHEQNVPGCITVAGIQSPGLTAAPAIAVMVADLLRKQGFSRKKKLFFRRYRHKTEHLFAIPFNKTNQLINKDPEYGDIVCRCEMVSVREIKDAIARGARTLDGIKFRTRAQAGRCHGGFCTTRIMKIMAEELNVPITQITKRGIGSEMVVKERT